MAHWGKQHKRLGAGRRDGSRAEQRKAGMAQEPESGRDGKGKRRRLRSLEGVTASQPRGGKESGIAAEDGGRGGRNGGG